MRSTSSPRAVSMRTGTSDFWRRRRRISKPSMPGSMTASTTRSTPGWRAFSRPRFPSWAASTVKPSRRRNSPRRAASSASSSTSRMFTARIYHEEGAGSPVCLGWQATRQRSLTVAARIGVASINPSRDRWGAVFHALRLQLAQRVAHDDALPAQVDQGKVVGLGKVAPLMVGGEQVVGTGTGDEVRLVGVAGDSGYAFVDEVGDQPLGAVREIMDLVPPVVVGRPVFGRTPEGARAGGDEFGGDGAGQPLEVEHPLGAVIVVGASPGAADDVGLVVERARGFVEHHAAGGQQHTGGAQPVVAGFLFLRLQVDHELAAIAGLERAIDHRLDVGQIVGGQAGDEIDS